MRMDDYQKAAWEVAMYPNKGSNIIYLALGLGEAGEIQGKVKKIIRDDGGVVTKEKRQAVAAEIGDVLWYLAALATETSCTLSGIFLAETFEEYQTRAWNEVDYAQKGSNPYIPSLRLGKVGWLQCQLTETEKDLRLNQKIIIGFMRIGRYLAALATELGLRLEDIAQANLDKLNSRKERGVITGSGDNR